MVILQFILNIKYSQIEMADIYKDDETRNVFLDQNEWSPRTFPTWRLHFAGNNKFGVSGE